MANERNTGTGERSSIETDLRALRAALARADEPAVDAEILGTPSWAPPVVPAIERRAAPRARPIPALIAAAALSLASAIALAAVTQPAAAPAAPSRGWATSGKVAARATARAPRPAPDEIVAPPEVIASAPPEVIASAPSVPAPRPRARRLAVPPSVRASEHASLEPVAVAPGEGSIDPGLASAIDDALGGRGDEAQAEALPATPSAQEVTRVLRGLEDRVARCAEGGVAQARLVIDGATGTVRSVAIGGVEGEPAACVAGVVGDARFPRFAQDRFAIAFPYRL